VAYDERSLKAKIKAHSMQRGGLDPIAAVIAATAAPC
jgi:hypothetical protein